MACCHGYSTGGGDGRRGRNTLVRSDGCEEDLGAKKSLPVQPGVSGHIARNLFVFVYLIII